MNDQNETKTIDLVGSKPKRGPKFKDTTMSPAERKRRQRERIRLAIYEGPELTDGAPDIEDLSDAELIEGLRMAMADKSMLAWYVATELVNRAARYNPESRE